MHGAFLSDLAKWTQPYRTKRIGLPVLGIAFKYHCLVGLSVTGGEPAQMKKPFGKAPSPSCFLMRAAAGSGNRRKKRPTAPFTYT